ncbi:MAG: acetate uptake transporter family protein [Chloroflexota bacterium]
MPGGGKQRGQQQQQQTAQAQIFLQPIAAPLVLGLYAFAAAAVIVGVYLAGGYGSPQTPSYVAPFVALFGGVAQFAAAMWGYRARDGLATVVHALWGSFWISYAILFLLLASGLLVAPAGPFVELGFWYLVLGWVTLPCIWAALAVSWPLVATLAAGTLAAGLAAAAEFGAGTGAAVVAGWVLTVAGLLAWYTASAIMLRATFGRAVLPSFETRHARQAPALAPGIGEPGVRHG